MPLLADFQVARDLGIIIVRILTKKPPEGGVIKLRVRTLLTDDSATVSHFCIYI